MLAPLVRCIRYKTRVYEQAVLVSLHIQIGRFAVGWNEPDGNGFRIVINILEFFFVFFAIQRIVAMVRTPYLTVMVVVLVPIPKVFYADFPGHAVKQVILRGKFGSGLDDIEYVLFGFHSGL